MKKFTICIEKKKNNFEIWSPNIASILIKTKEEEKGIEELKKRIRKYLQEFPKDLERFEREIKHIRLRRFN